MKEIEDCNALGNKFIIQILSNTCSKQQQR